MNASTALTWLILLPLLAAPVVYLAGRLSVRQPNGSASPARWLSILAMVAAGFPLFYAGQALINGQPVELKVGAVMLHMDGISLVLAASVLFLSLMVIIFSTRYMGGEENEEKFFALLLIMISSMIGLGCAADLFNLWVWFEAMAISSYMLVAFYRNQPGSLEAGVKYLVQSASGSVFVLLGIALVLGTTGTLDLQKIQASVSGPSAVLVAAGALFLIGFGVKAALVPMHTWLPDAHSMAPSGISAMLSGVVIETGLVALLRAVGAVSASSVSWGGLLLGFGALNMLLGNLMALRQTQVKRLLAYSSISHVGYMLVGLGAAVGYQVAAGAGGAFFHLITHSLMKGLAFLAAGALLYTLHIAKGSHSPLMVDDLNGASRRYPTVAFALSVAVLALGGLPPLAGFMSKWQIFVAGFQTHDTVMILVVIFAALNSVLSLGYYAPLVNRMFRLEPSEAVLQGAKTGWAIELPLALLTLAVVILGFWPSLVSGLTGPAATSLMAIFGR